MADSSRKKVHYRRGQSLVEMSIGSVILLMILMGVLDLGRLYFLYIALEDSAGEAAVYLAFNPKCPTASAGSKCQGTNNAEWRAQNSSGGNINWEDVVYTYEIPDGPNAGGEVIVSLEYEFELLTPLIADIARQAHLSLTATASQQIVFE
jgi:hypothetical protein